MSNRDAHSDGFLANAMPTKSELYVDHITMVIGFGYWTCLTGALGAIVGFALAVLR